MRIPTREDQLLDAVARTSTTMERPQRCFSKMSTRPHCKGVHLSNPRWPKLRKTQLSRRDLILVRRSALTAKQCSSDWDLVNHGHHASLKEFILRDEILGVKRQRSDQHPESIVWTLRPTWWFLDGI